MLSTIFLIAGFIHVKRLMPYTKYIPKPLLKISQNTIIHDLILNSINQGFYNFIISINYKAEKFKKTFDDGRQLNCNIKYLQEKNLWEPQVQ